jgi:prevent-host-death family protein
MASVPKIVPISDLRQDATNIVKGVAASREPVFITQRGRAAAVMVSMQAYEQTQHELEILRLLASGEKDIATGAGFEMDAVFAEADDVLAGIKP